eukprot:COSAG06_NODE_26359_length_616_cov_1.572534_2_plen_74_part_01
MLLRPAGAARPGGQLQGRAVHQRLPSATQSSWWSELLERAIHTNKLSASEGLSGRCTMAQMPILQALSVVEVAA